MTTDDLRTRARVEAEERYPQEPDRGLTYPREAIRQGKAAAFIDGALWHATQQPIREQVARAIAESQNPGVPGAFDAQRGAWLTDADAVLALFEGADRIESEARP